MENKILISSGSLYNYGLNRFFELAAKSGYDGIELVIDNNFDTRQPEYIRDLEQQYKIRVLSVHSAMEFITCFGESPRKRFEESIKIAKMLGVKVIVTHPHDYLDEKFYSWIKKNYEKIINLAKPVEVAFENHTTRRSLKDRNFFEIFPSYTLDTSHVATTNKDLLETLDEVGDNLTHVHLSDSDFAKREDLPELIADRHMIPGTGKLPLREFLTKIKSKKYSGYIVAELLPESLEAGKSDAIVLKNLKESLKFIKSALK